MNLIGKPTIHPLLFYTGKLSGYFTWVALLLGYCNVHVVKTTDLLWNRYIDIALMLTGLILIVVSSFSLGKSTRLGLPSEGTVMKTGGLYRLSRNPMYVGFNLITIASVVYFYNLIILALGIYSILVYHLIILGEEKFLENRFGQEYLDYKRKVKRYWW